MSESPQTPTPDREQRVEDLVDDFVRRSRSGEQIAPEDLIAANPDLQPELRQRLMFAKSLVQVISKSDTETTTRYLSPETMARLRCPHCGHIVQVAEEDTICDSCGSHIDPADETTIVHNRTKPEVGHFQLLERIGSGAFGVVYRAIDTNLHRNVAVKMPRRGYFGSRDEEARFLREARNVATLKHPNIVQVFEVGTESGSHYIATEFIEGLDLAEVVRGQLLSFRQTAELLSKIALALHHAHENNVIHRDVKPANIIIDNQYEPYLTDFGLARTAEPAITMTREGEILGTPAYMSPEQAKGEHSSVDRRSDVYSLGVTLFRMLSGELPFRGSRRMLLEKVIAEDPPLVRTLNDRVPRDLETIALRAMEKAPEKRYQTAKAFAEELQRWLSGDPIHARPISRTERIWRWCKKNPRVASLTSIVAALVVAIAVGATVWGIRESHLKEMATSNERQAQRQLARAFSLTAGERVEEDNSLAAMPVAVESLAVLEKLDDKEGAESARTEIRTILGTGPRLLSVAGMKGEVGHIAIRPDSGAFAVPIDRTLQQFDAATWSELGPKIEADSIIYRPAYNQQGTRIVATHGANHASLWDATTGQRIVKAEHEDTVSSAIFSPDGKTVATTGMDGKTHLRASDDGELIRTFEHAGMTHLRFSPDGKLLALWSMAPTALENDLLILDLNSGETTAIPVQLDLVDALAFESSESLVIVRQSGRVVRYSTTGEESRDFQAEVAPRTTHIRQARDGLLVTAGPDGARAWDTTAEAKPVVGPMLHGGHIAQHGLAISPDGSVIALAGEHDRIDLYWTATGNRAGPAIAHGSPGTAVAFLSNHVLLTGTRNGAVKVWDLSGATRDTLVLKHTGRVLAAAFSPDSQTVAAVAVVSTPDTETGLSSTWRRSDGQADGDPVSHESAALVTAFSFDGRLLASADADGQIIIRETNNADAPLRKLQVEGQVTRIAFPNGTDDVLAVATKKGRVQVFADGEDQPSVTFEMSGAVRDLQFHPTDDKLLAACTADGLAQVWNLETRQVESPPLRDDGVISRARFSPDGTVLATAGDSGAIVLWDWQKGTKNAVLSGFGRQRDIAFRSNGILASAAAPFGAAQVWSTAESTESPLWSFSEPDITTVDWHPSRPVLVSAAGSGKRDRNHVRLWDTSSGRAISPRLRFKATARAVFSPDGETVLAYSDDSTAFLWDVRPTTLETSALRKLSNVLSGIEIRNDRPSVLSAERQIQLFQELRQQLPAEFLSNAKEVERWKVLRELRQ